MKNYFLFLLLFVSFGIIKAQTVSFSEDFETTPLGVTSSGSANWARSSTLQAKGTYSDTARIVAVGDSAILTTNSFTTSGKTFVKLEFDQICKIEYFDAGVVEVSTNNGVSWTQLTGLEYLGSGQFTNNGNKFNAVTYPLVWEPSNNFAIPTNNWWQHEVFDISALTGNSSQVKVRFRLNDVNNSGGGGAYGWLLDNIKVTSSASELNPPDIVMNQPILKDTIYGTGPFDIYATLTDTSGIDTAWVIYTISNVTDSVAMVNTGNDIYMGSIPQQSYNTTVSYYIKAIDNSTNHNIGISLVYSFYNVKQQKTVSIGTGTGSTYYAPVYNSTTTSTDVYSDHVSLFTSAEMQGNYGIIDKFQWNKSNAVTYTGTASIEIYFKETTDASTPTTATDYQTALAGATLVYSDTSFTLPANSAKISFNISQSQFFYNGNNNLMVFVRWHRNGTLSANYLRWGYTYTSGKAITFRGSTPNPTVSSGSGSRPNITFWLSDPANAYDAGIYSIESPDPVVLSTASTPVQVKMLNNGTTNLVKAQINYEIDGTLQTPYSWTGNVVPNFKSDPVTLGSQTFSIGSHTLKSWTSLPNDSADQYPYNDTLEMSFFACNSILSGSYTIGGSTADFQTIDEAIDALTHCGVNNPVTFYINSGTYDGHIHLTDSMPGVDSINTVTFTSATGDYHDVVIEQTDATFSNVIELIGAHHLYFKHLTFDGTSAANSVTFSLENGAHHIVLDSCRIKMKQTSNYGNYAIYNHGGDVNHNTYTNNIITGGYYGIYIYGAYSTHSTNNTINSNHISEFDRNGIDFYYSDNIQVKNNTVRKKYTTGGATLSGIYIYHVDNMEITGNNIYLEPANAAYGMYVYYCANTNSDTNLISNNMVVCNSNSTSTSYRALYSSSTSNTNFYNNTFVTYGGASTSEACYVSGTSSALSFVNNIFASFGSTYALEKYSSTTIAEMNHNLYYTTGGQIMKWGSTVVATASGISGIQTATTMDSLSVMGDPKLYTPQNAHSYSSVANQAGKPLIGVTTDIDGDIRDANTPDIGADEFSISSIDAGVVAILNPVAVDTQARVTNIQVLVTNFGSDSITSMNINYILNQNVPVTYSWTGVLHAAETDTITFGTFTVPVLDNSIKVYTILSGDTLQNNDTTSINFYGLPLNEPEMLSFDTPSDGCGKDTSEIVSVTIGNNGMSDITSGLTVSYVANGDTTITENVTDTIPAGGSLSFTFNTPIDMTVGSSDSTFNFVSWVSHAADPIHNNDSVSKAVISKSFLIPPVVSDTTINYGDSVSLLASASNPIQWFANDTTSTVLWNDSIYVTPQLFDTTTYYARANTNIPPQTAYVGTSSTTYGQWDYAPYGGGMGSGKYQILYTAADLQAAGLSAGTIESIAFDVASTPQSLAAFDIYMALTPVTSLTTTYITSGLTQVKSGSFTGQTGWNTHTLTTPFYWDGTSSLLIQICSQGASYTAPLQKYTATSYTSYNGLAGMGVSCTMTTGQTNNKRPNIRIITQSALGCSSPRVPVTVNVPLPDIDGKVAEVVAPVSGCGLASSPVTIDIVNKGANTIPAGFSATYKINNGSYITPEIVSDSILYGDTLRFTFNTLATLTPGANGSKYVIMAKVIVPTDTYHPNDSIASDSIFSKYTPANPIVTNFAINYGDSANLTAIANDTVYWFSDSLTNNLVGIGNNFMTQPLYDTTTYWVYAQKTIAQTNYDIGAGTSVSGYSDPSPYGSGQYGAKHQFIILASELKAQGMMQGDIYSIAFDVASVKGNPLNGYTIKIGSTNATDLNRQYFIGNLTTVFTSTSYTEVFGWNTHQFTTPFQWDGTSNIVIETSFKNSTSTPLVGVHYTTTNFVSSAWMRGYSTFNINDTTINSTFSKRPNIRFNETGFGYCKSDLMSLTVNINNFPGIDAGLIAITNPSGSASSAVNTPIEVVLKNWGANTLSSATINWTENGNSQTAYSWTGNLAHGQTDTVIVAPSHNLAGGITTLKAWVSVTGDSITSNDTVVENLNVCMSGTYTVGSSNNNFSSINEVIYNLVQSGICGAVTINIDSGNYVGPWTIPAIQGSSATNTITFQSTDGDSTYVTLMATTTQQSNYVLKLDGSSYMIFNQLGFYANGSNYSNGLVLENSAQNITVKNSRLTSGMVSTGTASNIYAYYSDVSNITIENNVFNNGYRSIYFYGSSSAHNSDIIVRNNKFTNFGYYGAYFYYSDNVTINNNHFVSGTTNSSYYGIYCYNNANGLSIKNNIVKLTPTSSSYGIYLKTTASASAHSVVANNMISILTGSNTKYGIYASYCAYLDLVYNSVFINNGSTSSRALYMYNGSNNSVLNNIFYSRAGYALYLSSSNSITAFDYNDIHTDTTSTSLYAYWGGGAVANLAALKLQDLTKNVHSVNEDPLYISGTDLHAQQISIYNAGTPFSSVTEDIDGDTRSTTAPSIGADEFTPAAIDLGLTSMPYPYASDCGYTSSDSIVVNIKNYGINNINFASTPATITVEITGINPDTIVYTLNSGSLASSADTNIVVTNTNDMSLNGNYIFDAYITIANDGNSVNDAMATKEIISYPTISSFPFVMDFETGQNLILKEEKGLESDLSVDGAAAGTGNYGLHFEGGSYSSWYTPTTVTAAFANTAHVSTAATCNVDASGLSVLSMKFDLKQTAYSSYYLTKNSWFRVIIFDVNGSQYLKDINGDSVFQPATINSDPFTTHKFNLNAWAGQNFSISFEAVNKYSYGYGSYDGDNAFMDNLIIWSPSSIDVGVNSIILDKKFGPVGQSKNIKIAVENFGTDTVTNIPVGVLLNGIPMITDTITSLIPPSHVDTFTFVQTISLASGMQEIKVWASLAGDIVSSNDTASVEVKGLPALTIDYMEDFETNDYWFGTGSFDQWELGTPSQTSINGAHSGAKAWATRLNSNYQMSADEYLYTPYITIPANADTATLEFYQYMKVPTGSAWGLIEYSTNGTIWSSIGYMGAPNSVNWFNYVTNGKHVWSYSGTQWIQSSIKLDPAVFNTGQQFQFRFVFHSENTSTTDEGWAIDDFNLFVPAVPLDAGVIAIDAPSANLNAGDSSLVTIEIQNFGTDTLTSIPVSYTDGNTLVSEIWTGNLLTDSTASYTFTVKYIATTVGQIQFCSATALSGDGKPSNDNFCKNITVGAAAKDVGITSITSPTGQTTIGGNIDVKVMIANFGTDTIYSVPVAYVAGTSVANETFSGTILPGDSASYTFTTTYISPAGSYNVCATTNLIGDAVPGNDGKCVTVVGTSIIEIAKSGFSVSQNEPNPTHGKTRIRYYLPNAGKIRFTMVTMTGAIIENSEFDRTAGKQMIVIDSQQLTPGIYYYTIEYNGERITKKLVRF